MGMKRTAFKIAFSAWLLAAPLAHAQVPELEPMHYTVRYDVYWNGLPLGRIRMTVHEDQFGYGMEIDTKTRGLADIFAESTSTASVKGIRREGQYIPLKYSSTSQSDKEPRRTTITYDEEGKIRKRTRTPQDDPAWRPIVPLAEANEATDPITAFFTLRQRLRDAMAANERSTSVKTYEGARYAGFTFKVISPASLQIMKKSVRAINTVPTRQPINGYTPKEWKKYKKGDPVVHVYFSADARFIPLLAEAALPIGTLKMQLTEFSRAP